MKIKELNNEIVLINNVLTDFGTIIYYLKNSIVWDDSIRSRKTASFGIPYNYSNINYIQNDMPDFFNELINVVVLKNGFSPNNCLINYYYENSSKMGFHSDQTDILFDNTGIVIFSFGFPRVLRFKNKNDTKLIFDVLLENNSYFYMSQNVQNHWLHSILPESNNDSQNERFSLTFRKIICNSKV